MHTHLYSDHHHTRKKYNRFFTDSNLFKIRRALYEDGKASLHIFHELWLLLVWPLGQKTTVFRLIQGASFIFIQYAQSEVKVMDDRRLCILALTRFVRDNPEKVLEYIMCDHSDRTALMTYRVQNGESRLCTYYADSDEINYFHDELVQMTGN